MMPPLSVPCCVTWCVGSSVVVPEGRFSQPRNTSVPLVRSAAGILQGNAPTGDGADVADADAEAEALALAEADGLGETLAAALLLPHAVISRSATQAKRRIARAI